MNFWCSKYWSLHGEIQNHELSQIAEKKNWDFLFSCWVYYLGENGQHNCNTSLLVLKPFLKKLLQCQQSHHYHSTKNSSNDHYSWKEKKTSTLVHLKRSEGGRRPTERSVFKGHKATSTCRTLILGGVCVFSMFVIIVTWNFVGVIGGPLRTIFGKKFFRNFSKFSRKFFALPCLSKKLQAS